MAERIEIFKLDIDIDSVISSSKDLKAETDSLKRKLDSLKGTTKENSREYVELEARYKSTRKEYNSSQRELGKLINLQGKEIKTIEQGRNALSVISKEWAKQADLYGENSDQALKLAKKKKELTDQLKKEEKATGDTSRNVGNYAEGMGEALRGTSLFGNEVTQVTGYLRGFLPVITTVKDQTLAAGKQMIYSAKGTEGLSKAQRAAAITTNVFSGALKLLRVALIATGIGAIIVLLGSLVAYFGSTQKGIDKVNKVLVPLKVVFQTLFGVLQDVGEALAGLFTADGIKQFGKLIEDLIVKKFEQAQKVLGGIGKILTGDFKDGFNDIKAVGNEVVDEIETGYDKLVKVGKQLGETIDEAYKRGQRIQELNIDIEESENRLILLQSEANKNIKEANKIAEDRSKSQKEREDAARRSVELSEDLLEVQNEQLDKKIEQIRLEQQSNDTNREDQKELNELIAQKNENESAALELQTTQVNKLNTIRQEIAAEAKKASDAAIKRSQTELQIYIAQQGEKAKALEKEIDIAEKVRDEKLRILADELSIGKKTREEAQLEELEIKKEFAEKQSEATLKNLNQELDLYIAQNRSKIDSETQLTDDLVKVEQDRQRDIYSKKLEILEKQNADGLLTEQEFLTEKLNLQADFIEQQKELEQSFKDQKAEQKAIEKENELIDYENELETRRLRGENEFQIELDRLSKEREAAVKAAKERGVDVNKVEELYSEKRRKIHEAEQAAKLEGAEGVLNGLADLLGKETAAGKAVAIAKATIDTYKAANLALSTYPPPFGAIAAATSVAAGLVNVGKIAGVSADIPKAEKGGLFEIGGKRHSQGGTKFWGEDGTSFEAEKGELIGVMQRNAAATFMKYNNSFGGGRSNGNYLASGGIVSRGGGQTVKVNTQQIDYKLMASLLQESLQQLPRPVVAVEDINTGQKKYTDVVNGANL